MPEEPSIASLQRSLRHLRQMVLGLVILILGAGVGALREVYRVEKKVDSLTAQMDELRSWAGSMTSQVKKITIVTGAAEKLTEESVKEEVADISVIVLTKWKQNGRTWRCIIDEVLRQNAKMPFGLKSGDEFVPASEDVIGGYTKGTGVILFFKGSSYALHEMAVHYFDYKEKGAPPHANVPPANGSDLRIPRYGHMPVQRFKEIVAEQR